jgi:hypothetical protein
MDSELAQRMVALAQVVRRLPDTAAAAEVRDQVVGVIRKLEAMELLTVRTWPLGPE